MNFLTSLFGSSDENNSPQSRKTPRRLKGRSLRMESLEERALLSISPAGLAAVQDLFPNYEVDENVNCIYISGASDLPPAMLLQRAVEQAGQTESDDIIFLDTTISTYRFSAPLTIDIDAEQYGSVMIVGLNDPINFISTGAGRVVDIAAGSHVLLGNVGISGGKLLQSGENGAGIRSVDAVMELSDVFITACSTAQGGYGGAVFQLRGESVLNNVQMEYNQATYGGGFALVEGASTQTNVRYEGNNYSSTGGGYGGAVFARNAELTMTNAQVNFNKALRGAGLFLDASTATVTNATIASNSGFGGNSGGTGINAHMAVDLTLNNSIVLGNIADTELARSNDVYFYSGSIQFDNNIISTYSSYNNKFDTTTNRLGLDSVEAVFQNLDTFQLAQGSAAINAGNNDFVQGVATDIGGNARIRQGTVDLGAWESAFASAMLGPDLAPTTPEGWESPLIISLNPEAVADDAEFLLGQRLYARWALQNIGGQAGDNGFEVAVKVDGDIVWANYYSAGIPSGFVLKNIEIDLGYLSVGEHAIELVIDPWNVLNETDETNNVFSKTIFVTGPMADLTPFAPENWSSPIVCSNQSQGITDTELREGEPVYVTWGLKNIGTAVAENAFRVVLLVDGVERWSNTYPAGLPIGYFLQYRGIAVPGLSAGEHTLELRVDANGTVAELNESNNVYTRTINVVEASVAVTDLRIRYSAVEEVALTWTNPGAANGFIVQRSTDLQNWTDVGQGTHDSPAWYFNDKTIDFATTYFYRVVDGTNISNVVVIHTASRPMAYAVTGLAADFSTYDKVALTWNSVPGYGLYYVVQRCESGTGDWSDIGTVRGTTSLNDVRPDTDKAYDYRVVTNVYGGDTAVSEIVTAEKYVPPYDLEFFAPDGWAAPVLLVKSDGSGAERDTFYTNESLYLAFAYRNAGETYVGAVSASVYIDGTLYKTIPAAFNAGNQVSLQEKGYLPLGAGTHTVRVVLDAAGNVDEYDESNNEYSFTVTVKGIPAIPRGVTATAVDSRTMQLAWDEVPGADGYRIECYDGNYGWKYFEVDGPEHIVTGLSPHTTYYFKVSAFNPAGTSAWSTTIIRMTPWEISAPPAVSAFNATTNSVQLRIDFLKVDALHYYVQEATDPDGPWTYVYSGNVPFDGRGDISFTRSGLAEDTTYYYRAFVGNPAGQSDDSEIVSITTKVGLPAAPTGAVAELTEEGKLRVSWQAADKASSYVLYRYSGSGVTTFDPGANTWYEFDSPKNYDNDVFVIRAVNRAGMSADTASVQFSMPIVQPDFAFYTPAGWDAPLLVSLDSQRGVGQTELYINENFNLWFAFRNEGAEYGGVATATFYCDGVWAFTYLSDFSITGQQSVRNIGNIAWTPGTHTITVVLDEAGLVDELDETNNTYSITVTILGVPETAPEISTALVSEDGIDLAWNAVDYATSYTLQRRTDGSDWIDIYSGPETVYRDTDIDGLPGTTFEYRLKAANDRGTTGWSAIASAVLPLPAPSAPEGLALAVRSSSQIDIVWNALEGANSYRLERAVAGSNSWTTVYTGSATGYSDTKLAANTSYVYRAVAVRDDLVSDASGSVTAKTQKNGTAAVPTGLASTSVTKNSIAVSWGGNSSNLTSYTVQWSVDGITWQSATIKKNTKTYTITGLKAGTEYLVRVAADSKAGLSEWSDAIVVQTKG